MGGLHNIRAIQIGDNMVLLKSKLAGEIERARMLNKVGLEENFKM
jgi:hypothetical protein